MPYCPSNCIDMPASFPCSEYSLWRSAASKLFAAVPVGDPAWEHLAASNLTGRRFRQALEYWDELKTFVTHTKNGGSHEEQYETDKQMFGLLTAVVSCIESTIYSIAAVASLPSVAGIPFDLKAQKSGSDPTWLAQKLATNPKATQLCIELTKLAAAPEWQFFMTFRNRVSHRSNLSRVGYATSAGNALPPPDDFRFSATTNTPDTTKTIADFDADLAWLAVTIKALMVNAHTLL